MHLPILVKLTATIIALSSAVTLWLPSPLMARGNNIHGERLYQTYCYVCHGPEGKANGVGAQHLVVKPRNLSDDSYMSSRTDQQLFDAIRNTGAAPQGHLAMPLWGNQLSESHAWDLVAFVRTLHRSTSQQVQQARGAKLFSTYCWTCHGWTGTGDGILSLLYEPRPRSLADRAVQLERSDEDFYRIIHDGGGAATGHAAAMPAWGHVLSSQEIQALVAYIRGLGQ